MQTLEEMQQWNITNEVVVEMLCSYKVGSVNLYRYVGHTTYDEAGASHTTIYLNTYPVVRETKHCYVIDDYDKERYVLKSQTGQRFAYLTKELAAISFELRCKWRIAHAHRNVQTAHLIDEARKQLLKGDTSNA